MAGGLLTGLYSGTRGLDLGPSKFRADEDFRRKQLMEDMRRALSGEKMQASELALRQGSLDQQRDIEMKRQALEQKMGEARMNLDRDKLGLEQQAMQGYVNGQPTLDREKLTAATMSDIPPWQKAIAQAKLVIEADKSGFIYNPLTGEMQKKAAPQKAATPGAGGTEEEGGDFWGSLTKRILGSGKTDAEKAKDPDVKKQTDKIGSAKSKWTALKDMTTPQIAKEIMSWSNIEVMTMAAEHPSQTARQLAEDELVRRTKEAPNAR